MRARTNFFIDAVALVIYLVATNPIATGTPVHEWLSIGIAFVAFVHLVLHWDWAVHVSQRLVRKLGAASRVNFVIDVALLAGFVTVVMSGLAVSKSALGPFGHLVAETSPWHAIHSQSSTVLLALMGLHLGLHWHWLVSTFRHQVVAPLRSPNAVHQRRPGPASKPRATAVRRGHGRWHVLGSAAAAALLVLAVAGAVSVAVGQTGGRLLPVWLALPGESGAALASSTAIAAPTPGMSTEAISSSQRQGASARGFSGTQTQRVAVRTSHSLVVVVLALLLGLAMRGLLRIG